MLGGMYVTFMCFVYFLPPPESTILLVAAGWVPIIVLWLSAVVIPLAFVAMCLANLWESERH